MNVRRWVLGCALVSAVGLGGCERTGGRAGGRATRAPSADDLGGITLEQRTVAPSGPSATRYGAPSSHALSAMEAAIVERLSSTGMVASTALSAMTRELAAASPEEINVPPSLVDGLMAWAGLVDPPPRLVMVELGGDRSGCDRTPSAACQSAIESLAQQTTAFVETGADAGDTLLFGVGVAALGGGRTRMMVALLQRAVLLEPVDVVVPVGGSVDIRGRLLGARQQPSLEVVRADGGWSSTPVSLSVDGSFSATVQCASKGPQQVEVLADGEHGPEVVANFPVYCGQSPPKTLSVTVEHVGPDVDANQIARANFIYLNEERERRGLPTLSWDPDASSIALAHSQDMRDAGFVGHRSPNTGDVTARFSRGGLTGTVIRENVARGYGPRGIHDSLMRSPGHRINMLAPDVTHVGIGAVFGPAEANVPTAPRPVFATQNYYKPPGAGAPPDRALASTLRERIDAIRTDAALPPIVWDARLDKLATRRAESVARGREPAADLPERVFALGFAAVQSHQLASIDFDALSTAEVWRQPLTDAVGLGVVRAEATRTEDERFVVMLIVAEKG